MTSDHLFLLFVIGSVLSFFVETIFGSVSWNHSYQRGSLFGGRTSLTFMFFWGVLGSFYISFVHPFLFSLITLVPERIKLSVVCILFIFLAYNLVLSCLALERWKERNGGIARMGRISSFFAEQFPDARMEQIYPDMKFTLIKADG